MKSENTIKSEYESREEKVSGEFTVLSQSSRTIILFFASEIKIFLGVRYRHAQSTIDV